MNYFQKIFFLFLILCFLQSSCANAQGQYSSEAIYVFNSALSFQKQGNYEMAAQKYNQALIVQPDLNEAKKNLAILYQNWAYACYCKTDYTKAIELAKKALYYKPQSELSCYQILGQSYLALKDYKNATYSYNKVLSFSPEDKTALQNLKYISYHHNEKIINDSINNLNASHFAPYAVYKLIKPSAGISSYTVENTKKILDLIWEDPSGRILLEALMKKGTPINITQGALNANAQSMNKKHTIYLYGFIPVASFSTYSRSVNIPFNYISDFYNPNLPSYKRVYSLHVFIHEFGHAFMNIKNPKNTDSIEEELGVSMIGYNIAHKALTGKYLDREQTKTYSMGCLESLLSDSHRDLPVYSGFTQSIQKYGIILPYPETYTNLPAMYKELLREGKTNPVANFYQYSK